VFGDGGAVLTAAGRERLNAVEAIGQLGPTEARLVGEPAVVAHVDEGGGTGTIVVQMSDNANEYVIADAAMVQYIGPPGSGLRAATFGPSCVVPAMAGRENELPSTVHRAIPPEGGTTNSLRTFDLQPALADAKSLWAATGLSAAEQARLESVLVQVAPLSSNVLGWAAADGTTIWIDTDAAGHGWDTSREPRAESR
jgi:hypothetical protein